MLLCENGKKPVHIPTVAQQVFDVSGAGDTVIAVFTAAIAAGASPVEAAILANCAAGVVVGKLGTATTTTHEILESFPMASSQLDRQIGRPLAMTNGSMRASPYLSQVGDARKTIILTDENFRICTVLEVGGTQVNAIDLSATLRDVHGHDVVYFATPGPMLKLDRGEGSALSCQRQRQSFIRHLRECVPSVTLYTANAPMLSTSGIGGSASMPIMLHIFRCRLPMVVTDMCMSLCRLLPKSLPTTFGIPELVDLAKKSGRRKLELILPPVDVVQNAPGAVNPQPFQERFGFKDARDYACDCLATQPLDERRGPT